MLMLIARSAAGEPPAKMTAALENAIREVDPDFDRGGHRHRRGWLRKKSMDDFFNQFGVAAIAGGVTLLLAALGIYGVVGLMVTRRTREMAVRVTLGASRPRVIGMILFDVVKLVAPGVAVGVLITVAACSPRGRDHPSAPSSRWPTSPAPRLRSSPRSLASLAPARRAASVQPMVAMRSTSGRREATVRKRWSVRQGPRNVLTLVIFFK